jgi:hypothetical protein
MKDRTTKQVWFGEVLVRGEGNGGDEGAGIWLVSFIYIYELEP